ncbi:TPA: hypothetical protein PXQ76_002508 [Yersinia enterocolitica]|nr:hypothetical protein [Yersinia enterocolitica]HDL8026148.1 hypothetical protein [Yersinia enterocolitica]HDL8160832.1 hypothetical protein [Yersinia enterocolitica]HDL8164678.1 hypothetical protein [Yersinia enterocolitica]HDL8168724.1 hypothetical protein [Yersinia enterocolitica]
MSWQGIPFVLTPEHVLSGSYLAISKIPKIVIESEFAWDAVLGSLLAGCISAVVALYAIKNSKDLVKQQQEAEISRKTMDLDAEKNKREEEFKIERVKNLEMLCNDFISEIEVLGAALVRKAKADRLRPNSLDKQIDEAAFKFHYEISVRLNKQINSITLLLDTNNPSYKNILNYLRELQLLIKNGPKGSYSVEDSNLPDMAAYVNNFLVSVRTYTDYEFKVIYKSS